MATVVAIGLTAAELAARSPVALGRHPENMAALMRESERAGVVERVEGVWRLTERARREYGWALASPENE